MNKLNTTLILFVLSFCLLEVNGQSTNNLELFASGITDPVCIANAGDSRLFIVSQPGYIYIIDETGNVNPTPFLDIHNKVQYGGEQGLLGVAFHPAYNENGYFYVNYIGNGDSTHISRFNVSSSNPDLAESSSEMKLLTLYQPFTNHNGGDLNFGPDGYLYFGLGDGGSGGDPGNRAQNLLQYLGKLHRIDVDQGNPYAIPVTNPFYNNPSALGEIWAYGLRNPWRFSFDRLTGDLWIADVGQNLYEEIDFQPSSDSGGENYGWRCYEANTPYNTDGCGSSENYTFPIYAYSHTMGCSVTGGYVYRGSLYPAFYGHYFFADYCSDRIWTIHNDNGEWVTEDFGQFTGNNFSTFGENFQGELFVAGLTSGNIYRVTDTSVGGVESYTKNDVKIFPNPFTAKIWVETGKKGQSEALFSVLNLQGEKVFETTRNESDPVLELGFLPEGMYILMIEIKGYKSYQKIVKKD